MNELNFRPDFLDQLAESGVAISQDIISPQFTAALLEEALNLQSSFKHAGISKSAQIETNIRQDTTLWLNNTLPVGKKYLELMSQFQEVLNREFFLGLKSYEAHYARYQEGQFYKTHIDNFKSQGTRRITTVFFLNPAWNSNNSGELLIYSPDSQELMLTVEPQATTLVVFKSETFPHEVKPPKGRDRWSIAGWFRID